MTLIRRLSGGKRLAVVVALVLAVGGAMTVASATPKPPTPSILTGPANPTGSSSATFTFSDTQAGVTFKCSLDGSSFGTCTSPRSYSGLSGGTHTFRVEALAGSSSVSDVRSSSWLIDKSAPSITITFPADGGAYNTAGWAGGCAPVGICGTATDSAGVSSVALAIYQQSSHKYWNGTSFSSNSIVFNAASGATAWKYAKAVPADGQYTASARATDTFGNTTESNKYKTASFTIDNVAPVAPTLIEKPSNPSRDKTPEFEFVDASFPVAFTCRLDSGATVPCTGDTDHDGDDRGRHSHDDGHGHDGHYGDDYDAFGEINYGTLAVGPHCFYVFATDVAGNVGPTTTFCWTISGNGANFTISGDVSLPLYPGTSRPLTVSIHNPGGSAITIPVNGITVTVTTTKAGCANSNFAGSTGLAVPIVVGPGATVLAPGFSVSMLETGVPQDSCKNAALTLHYTGSAN